MDGSHVCASKFASDTTRYALRKSIPSDRFWPTAASPDLLRSAYTGLSTLPRTTGGLNLKQPIPNPSLGDDKARGGWVVVEFLA
jgi:hypothetical protein